MIKPDVWIRRQCERPAYALVNVREEPERFFTPNGIDDFKDMQHIHKGQDSLRIRAVTEELLAKGNWRPMISPYVYDNVREVDGKRVLSYGTSSYGYDVRLGNKFKIFTNVHCGIIDPLEFDSNCLVDHEGDYVIIPPNSYILGHTMETFKIPRNVMVIAVGKSTLARAGAIVNVTPIEPGFEGEVVIEVSNSTPLPMKLHAGQGIAQFLFFESDEECGTSYADKNGKYQNQVGVVTPRA